MSGCLAVGPASQLHFAFLLLFLGSVLGLPKHAQCFGGKSAESNAHWVNDGREMRVRLLPQAQLRYECAYYKRKPENHESHTDLHMLQHLKPWRPTWLALISG